jgi:hypothetical protein
MHSSEPKIPKTHGGIWGGICPRTGRPYGVSMRSYTEYKGDHLVGGDEFICSECHETIKKIERKPDITYI